MNNTCLLVLDVQEGIVDRLENKDEYLELMQKVIAHARSKNMQVIYVVVGFRPGLPEISPNNKSFKAIKEANGPTMVNPKPALNISPEDIVVTKRRVSAFSGSDLDMILRANGITKLVLTGIATSGVVLSTLREAADKDYGLSVISDLCADFDPLVHKVLTEKVFPRQAEVVTADQWLND
jgi:nicotinamidase-related amidase